MDPAQAAAAEEEADQRRCPPCAPLRCGRCWHCGCRAASGAVSIRLRGAVPGAPAHAPLARLPPGATIPTPSVLHLARRGSAVGVQELTLVPKVWTASDSQFWCAPSSLAPRRPQPPPLGSHEGFSPSSGRREAGQQLQLPSYTGTGIGKCPFNRVSWGRESWGKLVRTTIVFLSADHRWVKRAQECQIPRRSGRASQPQRLAPSMPPTTPAMLKWYHDGNRWSADGTGPLRLSSTSSLVPQQPTRQKLA